MTKVRPFILAAATFALTGANAVCPPQPRVEKSWKSVVAQISGNEYEIRVPATLNPAKEGKYRFIHGGAVWEDDNTTVTLTLGHWTEDSFEETKGQRCKTKRDGHSVFVISAPDEVLAWHRVSPADVEPVVSATSRAVDPEHLSGIALSLHQRKRATGPAGT